MTRPAQAAWWAGVLAELVVTPWRENNPLLGLFLLLALIVEAWVVVLMVGSWR